MIEEKEKISAGILMYRRNGDQYEVLLVHPGGPYGEDRDIGIWNFPKGIADEGETELKDLLRVAQREFAEEMGFPVTGEFSYLGSVKRAKDRKTVHMWTVEGTCDTACVQSNIVQIQHPEGSDNYIDIPEIDRAQFFTFGDAKIRITPYLAPILDLFYKKFRV